MAKTKVIRCAKCKTILMPEAPVGGVKGNKVYCKTCVVTGKVKI